MIVVESSWCTLPCSSANIRYFGVWGQSTFQQNVWVNAVAYKVLQEAVLLIQSARGLSRRSRRFYLCKACLTAEKRHSLALRGSEVSLGTSV